MINWNNWKKVHLKEFTEAVLKQVEFDIPVKLSDDQVNREIAFIDGLEEQDEKWVPVEDPYIRVPDLTMGQWVKLEKANPNSQFVIEATNEMVAKRMPEKAVKKSRLNQDQLLVLFTVLHEVGLAVDFKQMPLEEYIEKGLARFAFMEELDAYCSSMPLLMGAKHYAKEYRKDALEAFGDSYATKAMKAYLRTF